MGENNKLSGIYLVFSDIQGNFEHLKGFLEATKEMRKEGRICLGDIVNKCTDFADNRCVEEVRNNTDYCVKGNHDENVPKQLLKLTAQNTDYLSSLPDMRDLGNVLIWHSSLREKDLRLKSERQIKEEGIHIQKNYPSARFAFFGHTHQKGAYPIRGDHVETLEGNEAYLDQKGLTLINPGGIGLSYGMEKTFARIDTDTGRLNFFTLEQAQEMSFKADVVNAFDSRWMPVLNPESYGWFLQYAKNDVSAIRQKGENDAQVRQLAERLQSFDPEHLEKIGERRRKEHIDNYSLSLATDIATIRAEIEEFYETKEPIKSRNDYLNLKRLVIK